MSPVSVDVANIRKAADEIIVLHEGDDDSQELRVARVMLDQADVRIFLGFGFLPENVRRLRLNDWLRAGKQGAWGTAHGLTTGEMRRIQKLFPKSHSLTILSGKCEDGVRECVDLFTA